jgi:hypothetical protein
MLVVKLIFAVVLSVSALGIISVCVFGDATWRNPTQIVRIGAAPDIVAAQLPLFCPYPVFLLLSIHHFAASSSKGRASLTMSDLQHEETGVHSRTPNAPAAVNVRIQRAS